MAVIDCDSHVMEPPDLWTRYLEPAYRDRAIQIVEVDGQEQLVADGQVILGFGLAGLGGAEIEPRSRIFSEQLRYRDGCPPASFEPAARAAMLDQWGVDAGVLFPTIGILPLPSEDDGLLNAYARAYNTWQAEFAAAIPGRAIPVATLNLRDRDAAIAELDRGLALGFRAVFLPPEPVNGRRPGDPWFDPLWRRCAEAGVPLCIHVVVRFGGAGVPFMPWHETGMVGSLFSFSTGAPGQIMPALVSMIADGVFDRIPDLKVVCVEAGCGWAAYLMDRLDEKHQYFAAMAALPLELQPSDYIRRNVWFVAEPEERTIGAMLDLVGEDRIVWGSDYPHIDSTTAAPRLIRASVASLSPSRQAAVLGGNAAALFALP
jgi:predicted TIM-barrel fold metal-dependent hydrolase